MIASHKRKLNLVHPRNPLSENVSSTSIKGLALTTLLPRSDKVRPTNQWMSLIKMDLGWRIFKINMGLIRTDFVDDLFIEFPGRPLWCESSLCIALADSRPGAGNVYLTTQQCLSFNKAQKCSSDNKSRIEDMISRAHCVILDTSDPRIQALLKWCWQQACIKVVLDDTPDWDASNFYVSKNILHIYSWGGRA